MDRCIIYLLVAIVVSFIVYVRHHEHLLIPWKRVAHSASGMSALTILLFFLILGLLDTVHFRPALDHTTDQGKKVYSVEVLSVLDILVTPLRIQVEKTYSAPLASHLYAKETVDLPNGEQARVFARLEYGGAHLQNPELDRMHDIVWRCAKGLAYGLIIWCLLSICLIFVLTRRNGQKFTQNFAAVWQRTTEIPWHAILITLLILLLLISCAAALATHYHVLGTDKVGQDILYQSLKSIRVALIIGTLTTLIMLAFALLLWESPRVILKVGSMMSFNIRNFAQLGLVILFGTDGRMSMSDLHLYSPGVYGVIGLVCADEFHVDRLVVVGDRNHRPVITDEVAEPGRDESLAPLPAC